MYSPASAVSPPVSPREADSVLYLDQWVWIKFARAANGRPDAAAAIGAFDKLRALVAAGLVLCPLSNVHYLETQAHAVEGRRMRLSRVMIQLSRLATIAPPNIVVPWEIDCALARRFGRPVVPDRPAIIGTGAGHAFGVRLEVPVGRLLNETHEQWAARKMQAQWLFEVGALTGWRGDGPMPQMDAQTALSLRYAEGERHLASRLRAAGVTNSGRNDVLVASELADILRPLDGRLRAAGVSWEEFAALGRQGLAEFLDDLPSRAVVIALRRQRHANAAEVWKASDLNDVTSLAMAVAYCNVVVTEKNAHALLTRSGIAKRFGTELLRSPGELLDVLDRRYP